MHKTAKRLWEAAHAVLRKQGDERTVTPTELANALGLKNQAVINNWESRGVSQGGLNNASVRLGVSLEWLRDGVGPMMLGNSKASTPQAGANHLVPLLDISGSMGNGTELVEQETVIEHLTLTGDWFRQNLPAVRPEKVRVISGKGNSMAPTFYDGDLLLVDTGAKTADIDGVYVLSAHGRLFIKTVRQRMDGHYEISSDNPSVKTVDILNGDHEVTIHGRVVWAWNGKRL